MKKSFTVFPAIDMRKGQVVRLKEGDPNRQTQYGDNPAEMALLWLKAGAEWLHVVNLDGAFGESGQANLIALAEIIKKAREFDVPVQFGGGMRDLAGIEAALNLGVSRAVIGTLAVEQPGLFAEALKRWGPEKLAVSLDARDGLVQSRGWQQATHLSALDAAHQLKTAGLRWLVFTDIARDGLQTGINLEATRALAEASGLDVIASGGVSQAEDVLKAQQAGLSGIIIGRALYEGCLNLQTVIGLTKG
ncbi:MAG: 1-(5-phosphoribosyl)-5-[(5-phosphoribosylamino)methylideneamino]imidazole-4-carboxamide isomerase [Anaerolineae bacterium]|nr:1-(5-phosphoribosyl)-5-[(5-phosphoribosylamino)methylideneamino]imidazole-4-carboxamide isomerase [Anaerolineae bacterium]